MSTPRCPSQPVHPGVGKGTWFGYRRLGGVVRGPREDHRRCVREGKEKSLSQRRRRDEVRVQESRRRRRRLEVVEVVGLVQDAPRPADVDPDVVVRVVLYREVAVSPTFQTTSRRLPEVPEDVVGTVGRPVQDLFNGPLLRTVTGHSGPTWTRPPSTHSVTGVWAPPPKVRPRSSVHRQTTIVTHPR